MVHAPDAKAEHEALLGRLMIAVTVMLAGAFGSMNHAAAAGRGGWSLDPFWWRVEFYGLATLLALCGVGFVWNRTVRRRDQKAHELADHLGEPDRVDDILKEL